MKILYVDIDTMRPDHLGCYGYPRNTSPNIDQVAAEAIRFERYSFPLWCNDLLCRLSFAVTGLYSGIFWAKKETFDAIGGFVEQKAMEDVVTAKRLKKYGKICQTKPTENFLSNTLN